MLISKTCMLFHPCWMQEMHRRRRKVMEAAIPRSPIINRNQMQDGANLPLQIISSHIHSHSFMPFDCTVVVWGIISEVNCVESRTQVLNSRHSHLVSCIHINPRDTYKGLIQVITVGFGLMLHALCVRRVWNVVFTSAWKFRNHSHTPTNHLVRFLQ